MGLDRIRPVTGAEAARWPDWYVVPIEVMSDLAPAVGVMVPGVTFMTDGTPIVHRSHLPLLGAVGRSPSAADFSDALFGAWGRAPKLRPWQKRGAEFLLHRHGALLADEPRLGKTLQALLAHDPGDGQLMIVCPLNVRDVWQNWCNRLWPETSIVTVEGTECDSDQVRRAPIAIVHYDVLPAWDAWSIRPATLILDEIHLLSNRRSKRAQAALMFATRSGKVIGLSGSPLWNSPDQLYTILNTISPGAWGSYWQYASRYASGHKERYGYKTGSPSHVEEMASRISEVMLRRTWDDVAPDLPPIERTVEMVYLTAEQRREIDLGYNAARTVKDIASTTIDVRYSTTIGSTTIGQIASLRAVLASVKIEMALAQAVQVLKSGHRVVLWCWHKETVASLSAAMVDARVSWYAIDGDTPIASRALLIKSWRDCAPSALLATIGVGQVGIDLSAAADAIFVELDWTPATIAQAEMRTFSPDRPMRVVYLCTDHPVEQAIVNALVEKGKNGKILRMDALAATDVLSSAFGVPNGPDMERLRKSLVEVD